MAVKVVSIQQARAALGIPGGTARPISANKFKAAAVVVDGVRHDSRHEGRMAEALRALEQAGKITHLRLEKCELLFALDVEGIRIAQYEADAAFTVVLPLELMTLDGPRRFAAGERVVMDAKSPPTRRRPEYRMKARLMKALHDIEIVEV